MSTAKSIVAQSKELKNSLERIKDHIAAALPATAKRYLTPERVIKVAMLGISRSPQLLACTRESILHAVMDAVSLGLEPAGPLGQAYLVPYRNSKTGKYEAQLIIGYRGLLSLARRSGEIQSVTANVVYEKDEFEVDLGSGEPPKHRPYLHGDRGKPVLVYCVARFKDGGMHFDLMTVDDVERIRKRSRAANNGPWVTDWEEMARKTIVRRASKYWPMSLELAEALAVEDRHEGLDTPAPAFVEVEDVVPEEKPSRADEALQILNGPESDSEPEDYLPDESELPPIPSEPPPAELPLDNPEKKKTVQVIDKTSEGKKLEYGRLVADALQKGIPADVIREWCQELEIRSEDKRTQTRARLGELKNRIENWEG